MFVEHLSATIINDQIFPHICQGFSDSNPAIREATIRAVVLIAPKLNYNNLNVELMKYFARLQGSDDQGMIRTNTTVCIGKIAPFINPQLRQRILLSAFPKAMRDPFPLARLSGIVALANTDRFYTLKDVASKVIPSLSMACVDPEKDVRDEAFKTLKTFLSKLEKVSEKPELALEYEKDVSSCTQDLKNETSWTSWAMTSLSAKMSGYKNKNQQPSVALNTQPLGPPQNLMTTPTAAATAATTSPNSTPKPAQQQQQTSKEAKVSSELSKDFGSFSLEPSGVKQNSGGNGWNLDEDNEWKDLDDDGDMEPLESIEQPTAKPIFSHISNNNSNNNNKAANKDWSNWENAFDDDSNSSKKAPFDSDDSLGQQAPSNNNNKSQQSNKNSGQTMSGVAPASSYNWGAKNEEDLFNSLVKGANASSAGGKSSSKPAANSSDWSNDWNDVFEPSSTSNATKRVDRQQRNNAEKQQEAKQSKPLKLGQKKDQPFF